MPRYRKQETKQTVQDMIATARVYTAYFVAREKALGR